MYIWYSFAQLELLHIIQFADQLLRIFPAWVANVVLLQVGMKCCSMRMSFDPFDEFSNSEMFCFHYNCVWQSWYSEINVLLLHLYESHRSCLIFFNFCASTRNFLWIPIHTYGSPRTCWVLDVLTWSNIVPFAISLWTLAHLWIFLFLIIGFLVLVGFVGYLCCFQRLLNPIHSSNHRCGKSSMVVEVTHITSGM